MSRLVAVGSQSATNGISAPSASSGGQHRDHDPTGQRLPDRRRPNVPGTTTASVKFADVVWEVAAVCAKSIATLLIYKKTGKLPGNMERSVESRLEAAEIIQQQQERDL